MTLLYKERVDTAANDDSVFRPKRLAAAQDWLRDAIYPPIASEIEEAIDALRNKQPEYEPLLFDLYVGESAAALR